ncbi:MAG TPA: response regulator transcription factor [Drouetiella sp.]
MIEDDVELAQVVADALELEGHSVEHVTDGADGFDRIVHYHFDLAVVDRALPTMDGLEICRQYRAKNGAVPILFLTGKDAVVDKTAGLDAGADDYLTKPFAMPELSSRVRALLRRPGSLTAASISAGDLTLTLATGKLEREGTEIPLLAKELQLLSFFMRNPNRYYTSSDLLEKLWKSDSESTEEAVKQTVSRLRKKIDEPGKDSRITTTRNLGYKFEL